MPIKKRIILITALFYVFYLVFPLFADTFNIPVWLPSMTVVAVMVALYPKAFANKTIYWFLVYALVLVLYLLFGRPLTIGIGTVADSKKIFIEFAYILPSVSIFCILYYMKDEVLARQLVLWSVGILFVSFIVSVPLMQRYGSLRDALIEEETEGLSVHGLPGYSLMHACTLFLPVMCYGAKVFEGRKKLWSVIGLLALCFVVYDTFVTTSLIVMVVMLLFTLLYSERHKAWFWITSATLVVVIYILYKDGFFISLIDRIMPAFEGTAVEFKLNDFKSSMIKGHITGGSITGRQNYHGISWSSFFSDPVFGTSVAGGHSSLLDRFGGMGLIAGLPFVMIFVSFIRQMIKQYKTKMAKVFFWVGIIAGLVYLYNKGNWGAEAWLVYLVLMPMGIQYFERNTLVRRIKPVGGIRKMKEDNKANPITSNP